MRSHTHKAQARSALLISRARRMGVTSSSAYLWMKAATPTPDAPMFARVVPARRTSLRLEVGGAALVVEAGFDAELLRQVVVALGAGA